MTNLYNPGGHPPPPGSYDAACESATTGQGLDPLTALLDEHDVSYWVEQTGGFCMVVMVPISPAGQSNVLCITVSETRQVEYLSDVDVGDDRDAPHAWLVTQYREPDAIYSDEPMIEVHVDDVELVQLVKNKIGPEGQPIPGWALATADPTDPDHDKET